MFILVSVAIAPSLALLSYFYLRREIESEPTRLLFYSFIYGAILTFPILFIQYIVQQETALTDNSFWSGSLSAMLEEFFKWLILLVAIYRQTKFSDPYDGILYGASVALGFATVENILFLVSFGIDNAFIRALLPVSSHALFGVVMGYYLGRAQFVKKGEKLQLTLALFAPLLLHFVYNSILYTADDEVMVWSVFMLGLWIFALSRVKQAHILSRKYRLMQHPFYDSNKPS
nr:glutamic-type intramembrane protease PrsW [Chryseomicrobium aureum]